MVIIKGWEERNGFVPSEQIVSNEDIRQLETNVVEPVVFNIDKKDIFVHIYGHDPLKIIFKNAISNEEPVHILLTGAPGTAKTLFLEAVGHSVPNAKFITSNSTGSGILTVMFEDEKLKYLCIDEIEKIPRDQLAVLLTLMESRRLVVTKKTMMVDREQKVTIFAMCNKIDRLSPELQSRFLRFHLKEYNLLEFKMVAKNLVTKRFNKSEEMAEKISTAVWNKMNSKDIRDVIKMARLVKKESDIDMVIEALQEYREYKNIDQVDIIN